jgi:HSP20 family protein
MNNLVKWEPFRDVDQLFEDFPRMSFPRLNFDLATDIYEKNGNVVAKLNVPGIDLNKINITVEDNVLHVDGSREEEKEEKGKNYYSKEIKRGSFSRTMRLPKSFSEKKTNAEYKDGVLEITMPVAKIQNGSAIKVKVKK